MPSTRMVLKNETWGRTIEQNLDFGVFFTGDLRCHLREWYQKLRHVDEATSKILTSMYFFTWDPRFHLREWYQKLRHVDEGTSKILTSMYFLHPQCHLRKWFQNKAMCTKPRAKSRLRCICYRRPAVPSARMVSKTKTCGQSDEQNIGFDIFLQETGGVICDGIKNWDMWTKRQSKPWLRCIFTGDPQCHLREWYQRLKHVDEATSKILTSMWFLQETRDVICENGIKN